MPASGIKPIKNISIIHTKLSKWGRSNRPGTVKSLATPSKLKPSWHRTGLGWYLPPVTKAATRGRFIPVQVYPSPVSNSDTIKKSGYQRGLLVSGLSQIWKVIFFDCCYFST